MIDPFNRVLTIVKNTISDICPYVGTSTNGSPPAFPYVGFRQLDNSTTAESLGNKENAVNSAIEITVYSNKNLTEARRIMTPICDAMNGMGYRRSGPFNPVNVADTNIYHVAYRFNRILAAGDKLGNIK